MKAISLIISLALLLGLSAGKANAITCDPRYVIDNGVSLTVKPINIDYEWDNANVECALEFATQENIPLVQLVAGRYAFERSVEVTGFEGTLRGKGMWDRTQIWGSGFVFVGGSPTVEHLSIEADDYVGILAFQDEDRCDRAMFVSLNRVYIDNGGEYGAAMWGSNDCAEPLKGSLSVNRSWMFAEDETISLYKLGSGARISLTNNDLRADHDSGICILSHTNHVAFTALANTCYHGQWTMVIVGDEALPRSDFYLRANWSSAYYNSGRVDVWDEYQRLNIHLEDNTLGRTQVGFQNAYVGDKVTFNALNNKFETGGGWSCIGVVRATSVIAGNECYGGRDHDLVLEATRGSTINQPQWVGFYPTHPERNQGLLSNTRQ